MDHQTLAGRSILIVEDEPLIAIEIVKAFEGAGALVESARTIAEAKRLVERGGISAAVVDFGLGDGDADWLCERLTRGNIPFVLHSGYSHLGEACRSGIVVPKPADPIALVGVLAKALEA